MADGQEPELALVSAVVRVSSSDGAVGGAGFLVAPDLVLTCAHVVSDVLGLRRDVEVDPGAEVVVDLPLVDGAEGLRQATAQVWRWVPIRADQAGDVAVLRLCSAIPGGRPLPMADAESVWGHQARTVGFTEDHPDGIWYPGKFRGPTGHGWVQLSRADGQAVHVKRGFSGSPVWDDELGAAVGMIVAAQPMREAQQAFVIRTRTLVRELPELAEVLQPASPFLGLAPFREADAEVFFGRDEDVARVVTALRGQHPSVTVYGPSGCGKSSVVLAGVVPRMRQLGYDVLVVDAGRITSPRAALATDLFEMARLDRYGPTRAESADQVEQWLGTLGLVDTFHRVTGRSAARLLVVLDQAEALLNLPDPQITETVELLFPQDSPIGLRVLATLRADFMDAVLSHVQLGPALERDLTLPLTPMSSDQLRHVVVDPLRAIPAVEYDPGLDRRILDDAGGEPGILPLLSFVLAQLWERRAAGRLRAATYEDLGGVHGALRRHAEQAWHECVSPGDEEQSRRLLSGLVRMLPGSDAPLRRALTREEAGERHWRLIQALAERRLLVLSGGSGRPESAELAHEALITVWPALAQQIRVDADFLAARAEVQHDLDRWRNADGPADLLPGAVQLTALETRIRGREADLTEQQREFLTLARLRQRKRRVRARVGWTAVGLVLALVVSLTTFLVQATRMSAQREAEGQSRALAIQSDQLTGTNTAAAALAALAAYEIAPTQESRSALMRRYLELKHAAWTLAGIEGNIAAVAMSAGGAVTLATTTRGRATLFVRTAEGRVRQEQLRLADNVQHPTVSHDGRRIAYLSELGRAVVWHEVTPAGERLVGPANLLPGVLGETATAAWQGDSALSFSPDARQLVGILEAKSNPPAQVWDLETGQEHALPNQISGFTDIWFGPDEKTLVAAYPLAGNFSIMTVDIKSGAKRELASDIAYHDYAISADRSIAVVCQKEDSGATAAARVGHYQAIEVATGKMLRHYRHENPDGYPTCEDFVIEEKGQRFAVRAAAGEWVLVGTTTEQDGVTRFWGPDDLHEEVAHLPLLRAGTTAQPLVVTQNSNRVTAWALRGPQSGEFTSSRPYLLGDGSTMVVRVGRNGDMLRVMRTEGEQLTLSEVHIDADTPPDPTQALQVNNSQTLVADVSDHNRITVRALPTLHLVAEFTTARTPVGEDGEPELLVFRFHGDDKLITAAGTTLEYWDAREGRRLSSPIDLRDLRLTEKDRPYYTVLPHPKPGYATVTVSGEPDVHAINLHNGQENSNLRVRLHDDLFVAVHLEDPGYLAVMTVGGLLELWSAPPGLPSKRVAGPFGPLDPDWAATDRAEGSKFILANKNSVHVIKANEPQYRDTYIFSEDQGFLAIADGGKALLRTPARVSGKPLDLVRLDTAIWKHHLCNVLGRNLTEDELGSLAYDVPTVCPTTSTE